MRVAGVRAATVRVAAVTVAVAARGAVAAARAAMVVGLGRATNDTPLNVVELFAGAFVTTDRPYVTLLEALPDRTTASAAGAGAAGAALAGPAIAAMRPPAASDAVTAGRVERFTADEKDLSGFSRPGARWRPAA